MEDMTVYDGHFHRTFVLLVNVFFFYIAVE